jgi:putative SOS response-associated peptidase YedK
MCGRFETKPSIQSLIFDLKKSGVELLLDLEDENNKKVNIAPTDKILSIRYTDNNYKLSLSNWGIKFSDDSSLIFNSRIETIKEKKYWSNLFNKNRMLVPMTAFYEWKKEGARKIPYRIFLPDLEIFFVPSVYFINKDKNILSSLITTTPNSFIKPIHHRMPVILNIKEGIDYLTDDMETNLEKCIPYSGKMGMEKTSL